MAKKESAEVICGNCKQDWTEQAEISGYFPVYCDNCGNELFPDQD